MPTFKKNLAVDDERGQLGPEDAHQIEKVHAREDVIALTTKFHINGAGRRCA